MKSISTVFIATGLSAGAESKLPGFLEQGGSILDVSAHANFAFGAQKGIPTHGHDPDEEVSLQGIDLGVSLRANEYVEGFINTNLFLTEDDELDAEWEEGFIKFKNITAFTGSLELRGGRYLNRIGKQNNVHLHGWQFIDANLTTGLFLGEEGLKTEGLELSWLKAHRAGDFIISASYGKAIEHSHEEHGGGPHDPVEETAELSYFNGNLLTVRAQLGYNSNDFNYHTVGLNYAHGENGFGRDTELFSADYQYRWRENGLESGGREWTAGVEYMHRNVEWVDEDDSNLLGAAGQQSVMAKAGFSWNEKWNVAAKYGWVEGVTDESFVTDERKRLSLALTHHYDFADQVTGHVRLQYNHDELEDGQKEDGVWLQLGFNFGEGEVR